ncbi:MAG: OmpA family protein, partial [Cyanobacteria bacterium P01_A01_bin.135]
NKELTRTAARRTELLTAIRSAAAARLAQPQLSGQTGKYRQGQILVELSEHCYLAALLQGEPPVSFLRQMGHLLKAIVTDHGEAITAFEGDADTVPGTIAQRLHRLMRINTGGHQRRRPARLAAIGLLILGGIAASVLGLQELRDRRLAALMAQVERTADLLNQGSGVSITARTSDNQVVLEGNVLQFNEVENIRQAFAEIDGVEGVIDQIETQPRTVSTQIYFYPNSATISPRDVANKIVNITQLLSQYPEFNLRIIGYHNPADEGEVQELALDRALAVADALADQGVLRQRLEVVEGEGTPPGVNAERQPWLSRAVLFEIVPPLAGLSDGAS